MRYAHDLRVTLHEQIDELTQRLKAWEIHPQIPDSEREHVLNQISQFPHAKTRQPFHMAGVGGSGDFPALRYADSFVYFAYAHSCVYTVDSLSGLKEAASLAPLLRFVWLPESDLAREAAFDEALADLAGCSVKEIIDQSDYRQLKTKYSGRANDLATLTTELIRPLASDAGNIAIQLRSSAEFGLAFRLLTQHPRLDYLLVDTTLSLPTVTNAKQSLFYEHLKRLCCVEARARNVGFFALSKSIGMTSTELLEDIAREKAGLPRGEIAEHWYLRAPIEEIDGWELSFSDGSRIPPPGAVTYLFRSHRSAPVLRLDIDYAFWKDRIRGESLNETQANEQHIFEDLDYASHDQRHYGFPYPVRAAQDRASLTTGDRLALRSQIIESATRAGLNRRLFHDTASGPGRR